jgi:hypothetical protein
MKMSRTITMELTQGKVALVSESDMELLSQYKWFAVCLDKKWYAKAWIPQLGKHKLMHQLLLDTPKGMYSDHIDGNGLNNARDNIRVVTPSQNSMNRRHKHSGTSPYKGVYYNKVRAGKGLTPWTARVGTRVNSFYLGSFDTPELAAIAYNNKALELYGEFAALNTIPNTQAI